MVQMEDGDADEVRKAGWDGAAELVVGEIEVCEASADIAWRVIHSFLFSFLPHSVRNAHYFSTKKMHPSFHPLVIDPGLFLYVYLYEGTRLNASYHRLFRFPALTALKWQIPCPLSASNALAHDVVAHEDAICSPNRIEISTPAFAKPGPNEI